MTDRKHKKAKYFHNKPSTIKKADRESLEVLAADGANARSWRRTLHEVFEAEYGFTGTFLEDGHYYKRKAWGPGKWQRYKLEHQLDDSQLRRAKSTKAADIEKQRTKDLEDYRRMYATVLRTLSDKQVSEIKRHRDWDTVSLKRHPLELVELIQEALVDRVAGLPHAEQMDLLMHTMEHIGQRPGEDIDRYIERARDAYDTLVRDGHPSAPQLADALRRTIRGLRKPDYDQYKVHLINTTRGPAGEAAYPASWGEISRHVQLFVNPNPSSHKGQTVNRFAYACSFCSKDGHSIDECWKKHPDQLPERYRKGKAMADKAKANDEDTNPDTETTDKPTNSSQNSSKKSKKSKKKKGRKVGNVTAYATSADPAAALWNFTAYPTICLYSTDMRKKRDARIVSIDTLANVSFAYNKRLLRNITRTDFTINGSTGPGAGTESGILPGFGMAVHLPHAEVNGLCAADAQQYDCEVVPGVVWSINIRINCKLDFAWDALYKSYSLLFDDAVIAAIDAAQDFHPISALSTTIRDLERQYPKREIKRAREARRLLGMVYYPSEYALARTIMSGAWLNCRVTPKDIQFARELYGPDEAVLAGKSKDLGPVAPVELLVPVHMREDQVAYADVFYWRYEAFLLFILKPLNLVLGRYLEKGTNNSATMKEAIEALRTKVEANNYKLTKIVTDPARTMATLVDIVPGLTTVGSGSHVPDAEVEIRVIEERCRCMEASRRVPIPRRLVKWLVLGAISMRNIILRPNQVVIAREAFTRTKFDCAVHLRGQIMDYVQAVKIPDDKSGEEPRTVAAIYLASSGNAQGSVYCFNLTTEREFLCDRFTHLPMNELAVAKIINLWTRDEPITRRKRRAAWKLGRLGRGYGVPLLEAPPEDDAEEGSIADIAVIPRQMVPPAHAEYPEVDPGMNIVGRANEFDRTPSPSSQQSMGDTDIGAVEALQSSPAPADLRHEETSGGGDQSEWGDDLTLDTEEAQELEPPEDDAALNLEPPEITEPSDSGLRRSDRIARRREASRRVDTYTLRAYRTSLRKALRDGRKEGKAAVMKELQQLIDKDVWAYMHASKLSMTQLKKTIRSLMFVKEKVDAAGNFVKMKARLVAGGDGQDKSIYQNLSSPTVSMEAVFSILAIAAIQKREIATVDITGAYLECEMPDDQEVLMTLDPLLTKLLKEIDPTVTPFIDERGVAVVKLKRALYGCVQSARLWFEKLRGVLEADGFQANPYDLCTFNKLVDGEQVSVAFHVDDLLITSKSGSAIDAMIKHLKSSFENVSETRGAVHNYLGMQVTICDGYIEIDMSGYVNKLLASQEGLKSSPTPAGPNLMNIDPDSPPLNAAEKKRFHSEVAKILFIAKRVRMMILPAVSFLAGRVCAPTEQDRAKLNKIFCYLLYSKNTVMRLKRGGVVEPVAYVDASWAVHDDLHGRTGIVIMLAHCAVGAWSYKQKMITQSSTECEIVALADACAHVLWYYRWLGAQGHDVRPFRVMQDNTAVLTLMDGERRTSQRTKHLSVRLFYPHDLQVQGKIALEWCPTANMIADLMTKPLAGEVFKRLVNLLMGYTEFSEE